MLVGNRLRAGSPALRVGFAIALLHWATCSRVKAANGIDPSGSAMSLRTYARYFSMVLESTPVRCLMWWSNHCSTVSVAMVVSTFSVERAFSAPNLEARSQNPDADSKSLRT